MVMILIFDKPERIRFFLSPSGGGESLIPGLTSTAWDFEYIIPEQEYEVGREYTLRLRLVYKKYEGDEAALVADFADGYAATLPPFSLTVLTWRAQ